MRGFGGRTWFARWLVFPALWRKSCSEFSTARVLEYENTRTQTPFASSHSFSYYLPVRFSLWNQAVAGLLTLAAVLLGVTAAAFFTMQRDIPPPETYLPAERTLALWRNVDDETARTLRQWFPILYNFPAAESGTTVVLLRTRDDETGWVSMRREPHLRGIPYHLESDRPETLALLKNADSFTPLSKQSSFKVLQTGEWSGSGFVFLQRERMTPSERELPLPWIHTDSSLALSIGSQGMAIHYVAPDSPIHSVPDDVPQVFTGALFVMRIADVPHWLTMSARHLLPSASVILQSVAQQVLAEVFGKDISLSYDLFPLLSRATTLSLGKTASGQTAFLLEGSMKDTTLMKTLLTHLQTQAPQRPVRRMQRTFSEGFVSDLLGIDATSATEERVDEWTLHRTPSSSLVVAASASSFLLSNSEAAMHHRLSPATPQLPPSPYGILIAEGMFAKDTLSTLLPSLLPTLWTSIHLPVRLGPEVKWMLTQQGERVTILVQ